MKKNINFVLIGVLTIASIILALPFTPLRNSFQGISGDAVNKAFASIGVDWNGKIQNARKVSYSYQNEAIGLSLITIDTRTKMIKLKKSGSSGGGSDEYAVNIANNGSDVRSAVGLTGSFATSGIISSTSEDKQSITGGGAISFSTKTGSDGKTTLTQNGTTSLQSTNGDHNGTGGGTHPGEDPNTPPPPCLPLGSGTGILLSLVGAFGIWKVRKIN